jgi:hypothetical protein
VGDRDICADERAAAAWALDLQPAAERSNPVAEPYETAAVGPGAAGAVVPNMDPERAVVQARLDRGVSGASMLCDIR